MRTLIADDDFFSAKLTQHYLEPLGEVVYTDNGESAYEIFLERHRTGYPFDLICLDISLPKIDGEELLKKIRAKESELGIENRAKIIMISTHSDISYVKESYNNGCEAYIVKPVRKGWLYHHLKESGLITEE